MEGVQLTLKQVHRGPPGNGRTTTDDNNNNNVIFIRSGGENFGRRGENEGRNCNWRVEEHGDRGEIVSQDLGFQVSFTMVVAGFS